MQLDVRARALMSVEEIKCPHKGFDSGGLRCFLSRARWCDNCFSNIRNLPPSKPELKKRREKIMKKKTYIKKGGLLGRVWTWHGFVSHTTPQLPSNGAVQCFWRWRGSIAVSLGSKKCHCRGPTQWHVLKGKVTSSELVILPKSPVWGFQAFTSTCSWNEGGAAGNQRDPGAESHVCSHPGSSSQNSTFQHSTEELSRF